METASVYRQFEDVELVDARERERERDCHDLPFLAH